MEILDPGVVLSSAAVRHMLLEDDDVRVWDGLRVLRREQRGDLVVEDASLQDWRSRRQQRQSQYAQGTLHLGQA